MHTSLRLMTMSTQLSGARRTASAMALSWAAAREAPAAHAVLGVWKLAALAQVGCQISTPPQLQGTGLVASLAREKSPTTPCTMALYPGELLSSRCTMTRYDGSSSARSSCALNHAGMSCLLWP